MEFIQERKQKTQHGTIQSPSPTKLLQSKITLLFVGEVRREDRREYSDSSSDKTKVEVKSE